MSDLPQRPTATSDARILVRAFRIVATLEAVTWLGLLIGMYFKWIAESTEVGVRIFGSLHGAVFVTFVVLSIAMYVRLGWRLRTVRHDRVRGVGCPYRALRPGRGPLLRLSVSLSDVGAMNAFSRVWMP